MSKPDCLDDGYPGCHRPQRGGGWCIAGRLINWVAGIIRRAIARPAKSAVATAALGLIVGAAVRTALIRHSTPNAAAGSVDSTRDSRTPDRHSLAPLPVRKRTELPRKDPTSDPSLPAKPGQGEPPVDSLINLDFDAFGDLLDDRSDSPRR